jgi:hypothetical protein
MHQLDFQVGEAYLAADSPNDKCSAIFEDDGETAYFYAVDTESDEHQIVDAVHIYNVRDIVDRHISSTALIIWSDEGSQCALLINSYPHAIFDFKAKRGYCRTNFPNFPDNESGWLTSDHQWSEKAAEWLEESRSED